MKLVKILCLLISISIIYGCEEMVRTAEIENLISKNDLDIELKVDIDKNYEIQTMSENEKCDNCIKIIVADEFYLRGKTEIEINKKYKLSVTMRNDNANPTIKYSFWKGLTTSVRSYTLAGNNENPPVSETQKQHSDWVTFEDHFQAQEGEESFMITLFSENGTFYLKDIEIEQVFE